MQKIENMIKDLSLPFEKEDETFLVQPRTNITTRIGIRAEGPIVTFTVNVVNIGVKLENFTKLDTHRLLWWNATEMIHAAYGITGNNLVLTGALELENLDLNEFQGMIDDISVAIDTHFQEILGWFGLSLTSERKVKAA